MSVLCNRIKWTIENAFDGLRQRIQRFRRGFSWLDVYDMDTWFIRTVEPMLRHLAKHVSGYDEKDFNNADEWTAALYHMADLLHNMSDTNLAEEKFGGYDNMTFEDEKEIFRIREENRIEFFELFSKYFFSLYD